MKPMLAVMCVIAVLGNTLYAHAALDEYDQSHESNEEHELQIGESPVDSGYGERIQVTVNKQGRSEGNPAKEENSPAIEKELSLVGRNKGPVKLGNSNARVKSSSIDDNTFYQPEQGKEQNHQHRVYRLRQEPANRFDGQEHSREGYESRAQGNDLRAERRGKVAYDRESKSSYE